MACRVDHPVEGEERFEQEVVAPDELAGRGKVLVLVVATVAKPAVRG
jgi:hypothetical protein